MLGLLAGGLPSQARGEVLAADAMIFRAFPEADSYRRIVRDVDQQARTAIERDLPFKVHFDELGPHTLFVAFRGRQPVGLLYLRSEEAEWGLTEIAWAVTLDMRVLGFQFLRGRGRHLRGLEGSAFARQLVGCDQPHLVDLLTRQTKADPAIVPMGAEELAKTVLRSGIKALLVTDTVWRDEVAKLQDLAMGFDAFPAAERLHRTVLTFDLDGGDSLKSVIANVVRATGKGDSQLGAVVRTETKIGGDNVALRWVVDDHLRIVRIVPVRSWASDALRLACRELEGHLLVAPPEGGNTLRPVALSLGEVMAHVGATPPKGGK